MFFDLATLEIIFITTATVTLLGWLVLLLTPLWRRLLVHADIWIDRICGAIIPLLLAVAYLILAPVFFTDLEGGFGSLSEVMMLFNNPQAVMAGWLHYLAFDLFIGAWQLREARNISMPHIALVPCLLLTLLFGPVGLMTFFLVRYIRKLSK